MNFNGIPLVLACLALASSASASPRPKLELPPCGILVGNAVYNAGFGFPCYSGPVLTHWKSYSKSPYEIRIICR